MVGGSNLGREIISLLDGKLARWSKNTSCVPKKKRKDIYIYIYKEIHDHQLITRDEIKLNQIKLQLQLHVWILNLNQLELTNNLRS